MALEERLEGKGRMVQRAENGCRTAAALLPQPAAEAVRQPAAAVAAERIETRNIFF